MLLEWDNKWKLFNIKICFVFIVLDYCDIVFFFWEI